LSPITWFLLRLAARFLAGLVAKRFDGLLDDMRDDSYANVSYKVFNIGEANHLPAYSMELGVGLENGRHIECIDRLLEIAASAASGSAWCTPRRSPCASSHRRGRSHR
jgi:hypothetical protein